MISAMRRLVAALAVLFVTAACGGGGGSSKPAARPATPPAAGSGRLFVQTAPSGTLSSTGNGGFALQLKGVPTTIWFTDRPARASGTEDTAEFVQTWAVGGAGSFAKRPPNALLEVREAKTRRVLPIELTQATYNGDALTYTMRALPRSPGFYRSEGERTPLEPGQFTNATVFIDDASTTTCWLEWDIKDITTPLIGVGVTSGGTFAYDFTGLVQGGTLPNDGALFSAPDPSKAPAKWHVDAKNNVFTGNVESGEIQFVTLLQFTTGATSASGPIQGSANTPPTVQALDNTCGNVSITGSAANGYTWALSAPS